MLTHAVRFAHKIAQTQPLASFVASVSHPDLKTLGSEEALEEYVKTQLETAHHPIGTASMLPREDGGVVDSNLKVYGVQNLRFVHKS
jgi:choline dehydrogenase-like flavoprotein